MITQNKDLIIFIFIMIMLVISLRNTFIGYILFVLFVFLRPQDDRPLVASYHLPQIILIVVTVSFLINYVARGKKTLIIKDGTVALFVAFFCWMLISSFFAVYPGVAWAGVREFLFIIILFYLTIHIIDDRKKLKILLITLLFCGLNFAYMLQFKGSHMMENIGSQEFYRLNFIRYNINFGQPNYLAFTMIFMFFVAVALTLYTKYKTLKLLLFSCGIVFVYTLMQTASRGATIAFLVALFFFWLYSKRKAIYLLIFIIVIAIALPVAQAYLPNYFLRVETMKNYSEDSSSTGRLELWKKGLEFVSNKPGFGIGWNNFDKLTFNSSHNSYIQVASELGLAGFAIWIIFFFNSWKNIHLLRKMIDNKDILHYAALGLEISLIGYAAQSLTSGIGHRELFYFIVAISIAIRFIYEREKVVELKRGIHA